MKILWREKPRAHLFCNQASAKEQSDALNILRGYRGATPNFRAPLGVWGFI